MTSLARLGLAFLFVAQLSLITFAQSGTITTYAGPHLPLNGAWATTQFIDSPSAVVGDGAGGFYVASTTQNRVYRVAANGRLSVIAGTGANGFSGDGGPAISAQLNLPTGVAMDTAGNLFIADSGNNRIRKVTPGRVISTVAGNGLSGFSGDGGQATSAQLNGPTDVAVDIAGNLFIADTYNERIRKVSSGGVIATVAGSGAYPPDPSLYQEGGPATSAPLNTPQGVAVDTAGNLFIADWGNHRVRKVTPGGIITTVAGGGPHWPTEGLATAATIIAPVGLAVDAAGNLFIAESSWNAVCKVTPSGVISVVAGFYGHGFGGDGGQATSARLDSPFGVAVDTAGNLLIADYGNNCVRMVTPGGIISTVAGMGFDKANVSYGLPPTFANLYYPAGLVADSAGNLFIADTNNNRIRKLTPGGIISTVAGNGAQGFGGDGGPAISAWLNAPGSVTLDMAGNLFIADTNNNRIRKVTPDGIISTVAGNGVSGYGGDGGLATSAQLSVPRSVAVDAAGNLFIADSHNNRVRKVTPGGIISTTAGNGSEGFSGDGGLATSAQLQGPEGVAVDVEGNLFIAQPSWNRIRKVTPGGTISTVAGTGQHGYGGDGGPATSAKLQNPQGVAVDKGGNLFIADAHNNSIRKVTPGGIISTVAGTGTSSYGFSGDGGPATSAQLGWPQGIAADPAGNLFIADTRNCRIRKVPPSGIISTVAGSGGGTFNGEGATAVSAQLYGPYGIAVDSTGNVFVADNGVEGGPLSNVSGVGGDPANGGNGIINKVTPDRLLWMAARSPYPFGLAVDMAGNLLIAESDWNCIRKLTPGGSISTVAGTGTLTTGFSGDGGPATSAQLREPQGIAVDAVGNLFISDTGNHRVRKVTPSGIISTVAGSGTTLHGGFSGDGGQATSALLSYPGGIAVDAAGNLFIADTSNNRVRKVTPGGIISTVAGNGTAGYQGDGGPAVLAALDQPVGLAVDRSGNLFIADTNNNCIRKLTAGGVISTLAGNGGYGFSGDGGPATSAQLNWPTGVAVDAAGNLFIADYGNGRVRMVAGASNVSSVSMNLAPGGTGTSTTVGSNAATQAGYATIDINAGAAPYGTAVFSYKQNGVTVTEAGVPASPPTTAARIFIDYRSSVAAIPGRISAGLININTGIAVVNSGVASANITYTLRHVSGGPLSIGHGTLAPGAHFARFLNELNQVAPDFVLPANFQSAVQFGSLEISSDRPLSILALRMTTNQRNEVLLTTTPIADLTKPATSDAVFFPQFADGGGYTTSLILLNASDGLETGTLQALNDNGNPVVFNDGGGTAGSMFRYSIPAGGALHYQTDGSPAAANTGWVKLTPDAGTSTPVGAGIFGCNPGSFLVTESGIPATVATTHARVYVDMSGGHGTGLAIANPTNTSASITIAAFQSDGITGVGTSLGPLSIPANGHSARFADEFIAGLPAGFSGVLDIISSTPFAALTMRSLYNERHDFLLATFPIADMTRSAPSPIVFPQIADGGGFVTQFVLIDAGGSSSVTLKFFGEDGQLLAVGK